MTEAQLVHATKKSGNVQAVDDFTLQIRDGEFLIPAGPSGCGKEKGGACGRRSRSMSRSWRCSLDAESFVSGPDATVTRKR